ncbi:hypothetical protein SCHPADRAFT_475005 [Schizopora paradoxa]|uniref:Chromatin elongation factor SPT5 n=1 Tax=Schizopora paradoxa TaxID=27342 RepID=A0A0H2RHF0_9AGAM|nr:hypothetical protein SCHPADRAFT_475005 [Schizopora paradoxa]
MRKRHAASHFLDLVAGVDDEEDSEVDELDELEVDDDLEEADMNPHGGPVSNTFHEHGGDDELDDAFDALLKRSKEREAQDRVSSTSFDGRAGYTTQDCATSVLRRQMDIPGPEDVPMYSIQVKRGKEEVVAFRLSNKVMKTNATDVLSILALPRKAPGRIYVEARKSAPIQLLCEGMHFIYPSSIFMVPVAERVALLQPSARLPPIKRGDFVKIRNGLYKNDEGEVVDVRGGHGQDTLVVKVKGREPDPRELKRKRSKSSIRREPSLYDKEELRRLHFFDGDSNFNDLGADGFKFGGKHYTNDGFLLFRIRYDRVERLQHTMEQLEPRLSDDLGRTSNGALILKKSIPSETRPLMCSSSDLSRSTTLPKFIRPGVRVRITKGASAGAVGRVLDVKSTSHSALVQLALPKSQQQQTTTTATPIKFDVEMVYLTRAFEIGDHVEVKVGELRGRVGMVSFVEGEMLHVVDSKELSEFKVLATFVDTYEPPFVQIAPVDPPNFRLGSPVKIVRGKHGGKTGRIVMIQREHIRLLEYVTDIELVVRRDNVEPFIENVLLKPVPIRSPVSHISETKKVPPESEKENDSGTTVTKKSDPPSPTAVSSTSPSTSPSNPKNESQKCFLDHFKYGFDDQVVYAWRGPFKGRFGTCKHMSGLLAGVSLGSAIQGEGITYILRSCLIARCGCVLLDDVQLPWSKEEKADIPVMFNNWDKEVAEANRPKTPPRDIVSINETLSSQYHDPTETGMWIFHEKIAEVRKYYDLIVKFIALDKNIPRQPGDARVLADPNALQHPIPLSTPATVLVKFNVGEERRLESIPVSCLGLPAMMRNKKDYVVIKGDIVGMLVTHVRSEGSVACVVPMGAAKAHSFKIEKSILCGIERSSKL